jgi:hypothetical protein
MSGSFTTQSTSRASADVSPATLRGSDQIRLVFKPTLVDNPQDAAAAVRGTFVYQRKRRADEWEHVDAINLNALKAGEGVRLDLRSAEVLQLHQLLGQLYGVAAERGVPMGVHDWVALPKSQVATSVQALLAGDAADADRGRVLVAFIEWLRDQDVATLRAQLSPVGLAELVNFDAAIGAARLRQFLDQARANLGNASEAFWQTLLEQHNWVLSQTYAYPLVIIRGRAYVGGKTVANRQGNIADFLYRNKLTGNSLVVEIKTPMTDLLEAAEYRNGVYAPSRELAGATQQLLQNRASLVEDYRALTSGDRGAEFAVFVPRALLVCGKLPEATDAVRIRSFERYRGGLRDVDIVSFDELIEKVDVLLRLLEARADSSSG